MMDFDFEKNSSLVYLAAPFTHPDVHVLEERFRKITLKAYELIKEGYTVISPINHNYPIVKVLQKKGQDLDVGWETWKHHDESLLRHSDVMLVYTLPGWKESVGVQAEIKIALANNIPITYID